MDLMGFHLKNKGFCNRNVDSARSKSDFTMDYSVFEYDSSKKIMIENPGNGDFTEFSLCKAGIDHILPHESQPGLEYKNSKKTLFMAFNMDLIKKHKNFSKQKFGWEAEVRISHISQVNLERFNKETLGCHQKRNKMGGSSLEHTKHVEIAVDCAIVWRFNQQK